MILLLINSHHLEQIVDDFQDYLVQEHIYSSM